MEILWSDEAIIELEKILMAVAEFASLVSAEKYQAEFDRLISLVSTNPKMGKVGVIERTRELYPMNGKYRIVYEISGNLLYILTVKPTKQLHTAETLVRRFQGN